MPLARGKKMDALRELKWEQTQFVQVFRGDVSEAAQAIQCINAVFVSVRRLPLFYLQHVLMQVQPWDLVFCKWPVTGAQCNRFINPPQTGPVPLYMHGMMKSLKQYLSLDGLAALSAHSTVPFISPAPLVIIICRRYSLLQITVVILLQRRSPLWLKCSIKRLSVVTPSLHRSVRDDETMWKFSRLFIHGHEFITSNYKNRKTNDCANASVSSLLAACRPLVMRCHGAAAHRSTWNAYCHMRSS